MATTLTLITAAPPSSATATTTSSSHVVVDIEQGGISDHRSKDCSEESDVASRLSSSSAESCTVKLDQSRVKREEQQQHNSRSSTSSTYSTSSSNCLSECSVVDLESGNGGDAAAVESGKVMSVHTSKVEERDCRICHLSLDGSNPESGFPIELGCSCKEDLAAAHKHCAEAWFKIRGNKTCEICGSTAKNVVGVNEVELLEQWNEANDAAATATVPPHPAETRHFWQGHRFLNFLLACMVFAFVISWLFHFNVPS